jgi:hypothetical protein
MKKVRLFFSVLAVCCFVTTSICMEEKKAECQYHEVYDRRTYFH